MKKSFILAGVSILLWSTMATVSKLLLGSMSGMQVLCVSSLFASVFLFVLGICNGKVSAMRHLCTKDYLKMTVAGLPGTFLYYMFYYIGAARLPASQAFIINYLWPIMSVVFACILLKEKLTIRKIIAIAMSFLGVITVAGGELASFNLQTLFGMLFCIGAAVSYGLFTALNQKWHYDKFVSLMLSFVGAFGLSLIINLAMGTDMSIGTFEALGLGWNGLTVMAIATVTWALALDSGKTAKVSNLAYITPFLSLVWTAIFLKEPINPWSVLGLAIIVLGIFVQLKDGKNKHLKNI